MSTAEKTARRVYSAEQLHRLRATSSAPKLHEAIEEHDGEDADLVKGIRFSIRSHIRFALCIALRHCLKWLRGCGAGKQTRRLVPVAAVAVVNPRGVIRIMAYWLNLPETDHWPLIP